jgi:hypothetical protein
MGLMRITKLNATDIAQQSGVSRDAVYAAGYRYRHNYPPRRPRGPLRVEYVYSEELKRFLRQPVIPKSSST